MCKLGVSVTAIVLLLPMVAFVQNASSQDLTSIVYPHVASSMYSGGYDPSNVSNNLETLSESWHSGDVRTGHDFPHWIVIDFETWAPVVTELRLLVYTDSDGVRLKNFRIEGSNDGSTFIPLPGGPLVYANSATWQGFQIDNTIAYRYYRLWGIDGWATTGLGASQLIILEWEMDGYLTNLIASDLACTPPSGTVPFITQMTVTLGNLYPELSRRIAGRVNVAIANGNSYSNWKSGWTNVDASSSYVSSWNQAIPALGSVIGDNVFTLEAVDVTPSPYNLPPFPPAGDTDTSNCTVTGIAP